MVVIRTNKNTSNIYLTEKEYSDCLNVEMLEDILEQYKLLNDIEIKNFNLTCLDSSDDELTSMFSKKTGSTYVAKIIIEEKIEEKRGRINIKEIIKEIVSESDNLIRPTIPFKFSLEDFLKITATVPSHLKECYLYKHNYYIWVDFEAIDIALEFGTKVVYEQSEFIKEHGTKITEFIL